MDPVLNSIYIVVVNASASWATKLYPNVWSVPTTRILYWVFSFKLVLGSNTTLEVLFIKEPSKSEKKDGA